MYRIYQNVNIYKYLQYVNIDKYLHIVNIVNGNDWIRQKYSRDSGKSSHLSSLYIHNIYIIYIFTYILYVRYISLLYIYNQAHLFSVVKNVMIKKKHLLKHLCNN